MKPLPLDGLDEFCQRLERTWWHNRSVCKRRDALAIGLGLCGLRWEETHRLRTDDVSAGDGMVYVRSAKRGIDRRLPIGATMCHALLDVHRRIASPVMSKQKFAGERMANLRFVLLTHQGGLLSYEAVRRRCREWTKQVFGVAYTPHCLRHTAALRCYLETRDIMQVHRLLGHKSLHWTRAYLSTIEGCEGYGLPDFCRVGGGGPAGWVRPHGPRLFDPDDMRTKPKPSEGEGGAA